MNKWHTYCFFRRAVQSNKNRIDLQVVDESEMTTNKMHRDKNERGLDLHSTYISFAKIRLVEMYVRIKHYDSSP